MQLFAQYNDTFLVYDKRQVMYDAMRTFGVIPTERSMVRTTFKPRRNLGEYLGIRPANDAIKATGAIGVVGVCTATEWYPRLFPTQKDRLRDKMLQHLATGGEVKCVTEAAQGLASGLDFQDEFMFYDHQTHILKYIGPKIVETKEF